MSKAILMGIPSEMQVWLSEIETEELYRELLAYFGLVGALNECQALEAAWKDPQQTGNRRIHKSMAKKKTKKEKRSHSRSRRKAPNGRNKKEYEKEAGKEAKKNYLKQSV